MTTRPFIDRAIPAARAHFARNALDRSWSSDLAVSLQIGKVTEELGEVAEAFTAHMGANPRKGGPLSSSFDAVGEEFLDVALSALIGWQMISNSANITNDLEAHVERKLRMHGVEIPS